MRYVGDRHQQAKSLALFFAKHCIVEISGGLAVDGDERVVAQVLPTLDIRGGDFFRYLLFQCLNLTRPNVRQVVFTKRNFYFHARIGVVAQHLDHTRHRF